MLSSSAELEHAIDSDEVQRYPLQLEWVINQVAEIDHYQPILFVVDSFDHLFSEVDRFERWMRDGKLYNVAPGLPDIAEGDLRSFLEPPAVINPGSSARTCRAPVPRPAPSFAGARHPRGSCGPPRETR